MSTANEPTEIRRPGWRAFWLLLSIALAGSTGELRSEGGAEAPSPGDRLVGDFLAAQVEEVAALSLERLRAPGDWKDKKEALRRELREMLGLWPEPPRGPLMTEVTRTIDRPDLGIVVEDLVFQSRPGLYVTANLYRPREFKGELPAVLYLCGHGPVKIDGVSYGNKVHYQRHPTWFARHGYVALAIDTLQLGEIEGVHHGTYRLGMWWWPGRGYTPAGVEAWSSIRALDLLAARPEVDPERIAVTGRSGGGIGTWWLAALDDRPRVLVPVAGITDLRNHILDGCIEGHCDCNYPINLYRWDMTLLAALAAPRPLLLANSDKDALFPLDGVLRVHSVLKEVYGSLGASDRLGLLITEGPHRDTQDLRVPAFRWIERWLRDRPDAEVEPAPGPAFEPAELKVLEAIPAGERNTRIQEEFVPAAPVPPPPATRSDFETWREGAWRELAWRTFRNLPPAGPFESVEGPPRRGGGIVEREWSFRSEKGVRLPLFLLEADRKEPPARIELEVLGEERWAEFEAARGVLLGDAVSGDPTSESAAGAASRFRRWIAGRAVGLAFFAPRGIGPTRWSGDASRLNHIRRRFLALGRPLDETRLFDTWRAVRFLASRGSYRDLPITLSARAPMAGIALWAAAHALDVDRVDLTGLSSSFRDGPVLLNVRRVLDVPQAVTLLFPRKVILRGVGEAEFAWAAAVARLEVEEGVVAESPLEFAPPREAGGS